ncbi:U3 small nucleolar RNA-associated protein 25 homolog [Tubulanus polymorphus]|uniref:U3 small nucleolar RNA-associated protein 25 homolog n=1 Tax=Tubulanus polymorphus TaxID=672921 RepID=UPI003DA59E3F
MGFNRGKRKNGRSQSSFRGKKRKFLQSNPKIDRFSNRVEETETNEPIVEKKLIEELPSEVSSEEEEIPSAFTQLMTTLKTRNDNISENEDEGVDDEELEDSDGEDTDEGDDGDDDDENEEDDFQIEDEDENEYDETADLNESDEDGSVNDENDDDNEIQDDKQTDEEEDLSVIEIEDQNLSLPNDPFSIHFEEEIPETLPDDIGQKKSSIKSDVKYPVLGSCIHLSVSDDHKEIPSNTEKQVSKLHVKQKLCEQLKDVNVFSSNSSDTKSADPDPMTPLQYELFSIMNNYKDLCFPLRTYDNGEEIRLVYCLHAINHALKTRSRIIAHNSKIKSKRDDIPDDYRDQGLTRPKVLIVAPFKDSCFKIVNLFIKLLMPKDQVLVSNRKRFEKEFGPEEGNSEKKKGLKPDDYEYLFDGNTDEHFRLGIGVAKKTLKLYTDFYHADIIIASPLGLRTIIGGEGDESRDFDFLSSIEILIFDQMDVLLMQNWDHVLHLMDHLHQQPKESHGVDFSRVRMWTLNGWAKFYRQTLIFSDLQTPEINALFNKHCTNYAGKIIVQKSQAAVGSICQIVAQIPQVFHRIDCQTFAEVPDARFKFFVTKILPQYKESVMTGTLIFVPSYFDYVRLRNYFKKQGLSTSFLSEYSDSKKISRARSFFYHGRKHFMLYTERFHFYRRYKLRGIKHIVFYELPHYPQFYSEMCNMLIDAKRNDDHEDMTCSVIYSKYDAQRLSGIISTDRARFMINSEKQVHMFVTGDS